MFTTVPLAPPRQCHRKPKIATCCSAYREGDRDGALDELSRRYMPLARRLASRYRHTGEPMDDLVQVANMALVKAIERFDPERKTAFSSFAVPTILGELKRYFRDHSWSVHVPRELQERAAKVNKAIESLSKQTGGSPSVKEIASKLDLDLEQVLEALEAAQAFDATSLEAEQSRCRWEPDAARRHGRRGGSAGSSWSNTARRSIRCSPRCRSAPARSFTCGSSRT